MTTPPRLPLLPVTAEDYDLPCVVCHHIKFRHYFNPTQGCNCCNPGEAA